MDPRHPELAIERMVDLMTRFNLITRDIKHSMTSSQISQLEREGGLVVQEICLVAPRLHEAMMQTSRQRRHDLTKWNGNVTRETVTSPLYNVGDAEVVQAKGEDAKRIASVEVVKKPVENYVEKAKEDFLEKPKKKRKTTRKKKAEE